MALYSVGYNFDWQLVRALPSLNRAFGGRHRLSEVYGANAAFGQASARPQSNIPRLDWQEFEDHVSELTRHGIAFVYLLNAPRGRGVTDMSPILDLVGALSSVGVGRFTVCSLTLSAALRKAYPRADITISLTRRVRDLEELKRCEAAGANSVYLDAVTVNRDIPLIRQLLASTDLNVKLYANVSCVRDCPSMDAHYRLFSGGSESESVVRANEAFFAGCTAIKRWSPVEWLQQPWIRPEDISQYEQLGVHSFKISDRLEPTEVLAMKLKAYLRGESPANLFNLIDGAGRKYKLEAGKTRRPVVRSSGISPDFWAHISQTECGASDPKCDYCRTLADTIIDFPELWRQDAESVLANGSIPAPLRRRLAKAVESDRVR